MARTPDLRQAATAAVNEAIELWIDRQRNSSARLTYTQIARVLREEHSVYVSNETLRTWHSSLPVSDRQGAA